LLKPLPLLTSPIAAIVLAAWVSLQSPSVHAAAPMRGRLLFLKCASCHDISATASAKTGPNLRGVVGRRVASLPGYQYSTALRAQTFVWDEQHLDRWLTQPTDVVPGTAMAFSGLGSAADRQAVIAYLREGGK